MLTPPVKKFVEEHKEVKVTTPPTIRRVSRLLRKPDEDRKEAVLPTSRGRWSSIEHGMFLQALWLYGKEWKKVQTHVKTRTSTQARSHAQKFFRKLEKHDFPTKRYFEFLKDKNFEEISKINQVIGMEVQLPDDMFDIERRTPVKQKTDNNASQENSESCDLQNDDSFNEEADSDQEKAQVTISESSESAHEKAISEPHEELSEK